MEIKHVEMKKAQWNAAKFNSDGMMTSPPKLILQLEITHPETGQLKQLIDFAQQGESTWNVDGIQRTFPKAADAEDD